jgi:serine/threonine protein kinase
MDFSVLPCEFAGYTLEKQIGAGGFGTVFQASDANGRVLCVKIFAPLSFDSPSETKALVQTECYSSFNHPNAVQIICSGLALNCPDCQDELQQKSETTYCCIRCKVFYTLQQEQLYRHCAQCRNTCIVTYDSKGSPQYYSCTTCRKLYDYKNPSFYYYLVMEYLGGSDLDHFIKTQGPLCLHDALFITLRVAHFLDALHSINYLHRDINPKNIHLSKKAIVKIQKKETLDIHQDKEDIKVLDYGLVRDIETEETYGNLYYIPPEQRLGLSRAQTPADIYALGGLLYFMLNGQTPYQKETKGKDNLTQEIFNLQCRGILPASGKNTPLWCKVMYTLCMDATPANRPTARQVVAMLHHKLEHEEGGSLSASKASFWLYQRSNAWYARIFGLRNRLRLRLFASLRVAITDEALARELCNAQKTLRDSYEKEFTIRPEVTSVYPPGSKTSPYLKIEDAEREKKIQEDWGGGWFLAIQEAPKRLVAIKEFFVNSSNYQRLQRAFKSISIKLSQQGRKPPILDWGTIREPSPEKSAKVYIVFTYQEGQCLETIIREKKEKERRLLSNQEIYEILFAILDYLTIFHAEKLAVRTIIPEQILYNTDKQAIFLDYGLVKDTTAEALSGVVRKDAWLYTAPELFFGEEPKQSPLQYDVWAVGVIAYLLVAADLPYPTKAAIIDQKPPRPLNSASPFRRFVEKAMAWETKDRYRDALEMLADFQKIATKEKE